MLITSLTALRGGRVGLHLDGEFHCVLHADAARQLRNGQELDDAGLHEILKQSSFLDAKARALNLLSRRAYSCQELYGKLASASGEDAAQAAVERMLELGFMDDEDYARRFAADCLQRRGFSPARTVRELMQKGVDRETARRVLAEQEEDPQPAIARVIKKKYLRALDDEKGLRKTYNALTRLGYRHNDIRAVIGWLREDENYYDA